MTAPRRSFYIEAYVPGQSMRELCRMHARVAPAVALVAFAIACDTSPDKTVMSARSPTAGHGQHGVPSRAAPSESAQARMSTHGGGTSAQTQAPDACAHIPFLNTYQRAGALKENDNGKIVLDVHIDVHAADCGAPDCYGHQMKLTLHVTSRKRRCEIGAASATARGFNDCGPGTSFPTSFWTNTFTVSGNPDLADPDLERIELRDAARKHALVLLPYDYYFYEKVPADAALKPQLKGEEDIGCCYGYASSEAGSWRTRYWLSPLALQDLMEPEDVDLDAFNKWATESELRRDLARLVRRGFDLSDRATIKIAARGGETATAARVTVVDASTGPDAVDARKLDLHFSRKRCTTCPQGMSGWWLWKVDANQRCKASRGHRGFSTEPCGD